MKEIEKLAEKYVDNLPGYTISERWFKPGSDEPNAINLASNIYTAYEAGFRKAREMAVATIYTNCAKLGCACKHVETIECLGEQEVT